MPEIEEGFVDISEEQNGGLLKKILVEGTGDDTPPSGSHVEVHYVGTLHEGGEKFDSSRDRPGTFNFDVGVGQVIKGWDVGICSMKKGEKAILRCSSDFAYGDMGSPPKIPGGATLNFEVELFRWKIKVKEPYAMTAEERAEFAAQQKDLGNTAFKAGDYDAAVEAYADGARYITHSDGGGDDSDDDMGQSSSLGDTNKLSDENKVLAVALLSNCAMARLKLKDAEPAVADLAKALAIDDKNVKATFRRAEAHFMLGNWNLAVADTERVLELDPGNKAAEQLKMKAAAGEKQAKQKEKAMCAKMFG